MLFLENINPQIPAQSLDNNFGNINSQSKHQLTRLQLNGSDKGVGAVGTF